MTAPATRAYLRYSPRPRGEYESLEVQSDRIDKYCASKGIPPPVEYRDEMVSGSIPLVNRPGGAALLRDLGKGDLLIAYSLDRLFRDTEDALSMLRILDVKEVRLHVVNFGGDSLDFSSPMGRLMYTLTAAMAEFQRRCTAELTAQHSKWRKENSLLYTGNLPYGTMVDPENIGRFIPNPAEQAIIEKVMTLHRQGVNDNRIMLILNKEGIRTRKGTKWCPAQVRRMIDRQLKEQQKQTA